LKFQICPLNHTDTKKPLNSIKRLIVFQNGAKGQI
jgi:hypothetical protein